MKKVSIGLPVYNGEQFLKEAIDSILAQTYEDFELVICDNASTDSTAEIIQSYNDSRIKYHRNDTNMGAAWNYNRVFELSQGEYFKWAAHDDLIGPDFLKECVKVLDDNPSAVVAYTQVKAIDENGNFIRNEPSNVKTDFEKPHRRFCELVLKKHRARPVFGLMRSDALRKTGLIGNYTHSDTVLVGHLALLGKFIEIPKPLFFSRYNRHLQKWKKNNHTWAVWFDPKHEGKVLFPMWKFLGEYWKTVSRVSLRLHQKLACYLSLCAYTGYKSPLLAKDLLIALRRRS